MQAKLFSVLITTACLHIANGIAESSAADTGVTYPYLPPDYTIDKFVYTPNPTTGTTEIILTVLNQGLSPYPAQLSPISLSLSTGTRAGESVPIINRKTVDPLGDYSSRTYSWSLDSHTLSKNLYATVDPDDLIAESNENNNSAIAILKEALDSTAAEWISIIHVLPDGVGYVEQSVEMVISTSSAAIVDEGVSGLVVVTGNDGSDVYVSDLIPLLRGEANSAYEAYHSWDSAGLPAGNYTLTLTIWGENSGKMDEITQTLTLQSVVENNKPIANDDNASTKMNESVEIDLQGNDKEPDGNGFIHYISSEPSNGEVEVLRGVATYTPKEGFVGVDHFSYQMNDYLGASDWADVTVDVLPQENGCTWIRDFEVITSPEKTAIDGWSNYELPETGNPENAALVQGNSNPDLFDVQPFISFPSCSLYFQAKPGMTGVASVDYVVLDKATDGQGYTSEVRTFEISLTPQAPALEFLSLPPTLVQSNTTYSYSVGLSDDSAALNALELPDFLSLNNGVISGTPGADNVDVGLHKINLVVDDGVQSARQEYLLTVEPEIASIEPQPPSVLSDETSTNASGVESGTAQSGIVKTGGSGGFNPLWVLLGLPLLRRLR